MVAQSFPNIVNGLFEFSPSGSTLPCNNQCGPFTGGGVTSPVALAFDAHGNLWILNSDGVLSEFSSAGTPISPASGFQGLGIADSSQPYVSSGIYGMAFDSLGALWVTSELSNTVVKVTPAGVPGQAPASVSFSAAGLLAPSTLAIDHTNGVWVANQHNMITRLNADGSVAISPFPVGDDCQLTSLAIDGEGSVWTGSAGGTMAGACEIASNGSILIQGSASSELSWDPPGYSPAIDPSGDLWQLNGSLFYSYYTEYLGAAPPVTTPLATALATGRLAARP